MFYKLKPVILVKWYSEHIWRKNCFSMEYEYDNKQPNDEPLVAANKSAEQSKL